ncbi:hypothetical protein FB45DRAFT_868532 [Roridomyces roridus]|uniref:Uncharacterized protein n=1 Tax=Roridomyces roridus TaxID=1738132 RepID=A0AAD7FJ82_9AGAR|nr:hypothetical protein FB45DRAFT_868532 [Roridomyces roridus]
MHHGCRQPDHNAAYLSSHPIKNRSGTSGHIICSQVWPEARVPAKFKTQADMPRFTEHQEFSAIAELPKRLPKSAIVVFHEETHRDDFSGRRPRSLRATDNGTSMGSCRPAHWQSGIANVYSYFPSTKTGSRQYAFAVAVRDLESTGDKSLLTVPRSPGGRNRDYAFSKLLNVVDGNRENQYHDKARYARRRRFAKISPRGSAWVALIQMQSARSRGKRAPLETKKKRYDFRSIGRVDLWTQDHLEADRRRWASRHQSINASGALGRGDAEMHIASDLI